MRGLWKDLLAAMAMGMVVPGMLLNFTAAVLEEAGKIPLATLEEAQQTVSLPMRLRLPDGTTQEMEMEEYLPGVVLGEMPAAFGEEALKAQAVVARTYTYKAYTTGGKHGDGSICTQPACCQAYMTPEDYLSRGGSQENLEKVRSCVAATSGQVLTYEGTPIEATYFSCSGGCTEAAVAVWGTDFPYLQSVSSPGEEHADYHSADITFPRDQLEAALGVTLPRNPGEWFCNFRFTQGAGVESVDIGGRSFTGIELRQLLGLRSTRFSVTAGEDAVTITTQGYGHRVGMSQYGADAMAVSGSGYADILAHYYPGTCLERLTN